MFEYAPLPPEAKHEVYLAFQGQQGPWCLGAQTVPTELGETLHRCNAAHSEEEGSDLFVSDGEVLAKLNGAVQIVNCHHGAVIPVELTDNWIDRDETSDK